MALLREIVAPFALAFAFVFLLVIPAGNLLLASSRIAPPPQTTEIIPNAH